MGNWEARQQPGEMSMDSCNSPNSFCRGGCDLTCVCQDDQGPIYSDRFLLPRWDPILKLFGKKTTKLTFPNMAIHIEELNQKHQWSLKELEQFNEHTSLESSTPETFENLQTVLEEAPNCLDKYSHTPIMFSKSSYGSHRDDKSFTNREILTFLTLSLFCVHPVRDTSKFRVPSINFHKLYMSLDRSSSQAKMNCLWAYFTAASKEPENRTIQFTRRSLGTFPNWEHSATQICDVNFSANPIEEYQGKALEVDFANKYIGGGVLATGSVQEEIRMVLSPELIAARLFTPRLEKNEALFISGAKRYSSYSGYADTFQFTGPFEDKTQINENGHLDTRVVAMDAVHYRNRNDQFSKSEIDRELNKAYSGFEPLDGDQKPIATGHWGCGVFNGDKELKAIIQLLAASEARRNLIYCKSEDKFNQEFHTLLQIIEENSIKVGFLYRFISNLDINKQDSVFSSISQMITSPQSEQNLKPQALKRKTSIVEESNTMIKKGRKSERENCKYGNSCYRRNSKHLEEFSHPGDEDWGGI